MSSICRILHFFLGSTRVALRTFLLLLLLACNLLKVSAPSPGQQISTHLQETRIIRNYPHRAALVVHYVAAAAVAAAVVAVAIAATVTGATGATASPAPSVTPIRGALNDAPLHVRRLFSQSQRSESNQHDHGRQHVHCPTKSCRCVQSTGREQSKAKLRRVMILCCHHHQGGQAPLRARVVDV